MSRKHHECKCEENKCDTSFFGNSGNCCCSFPTLIILILIILQFNKNKGFGFSSDSSEECEEDCGSGHQLIDNSILFIIALFFLACCNPCKRF